MKKTILMMVFVIVAMVAMPSKVMAANVAGDYVGKLTRVYMNKEKTPTDDEVITTVDGLSNSYSLSIEDLQIGNMPGSITVNASNLPLENGSFTSSCTVQLTILGNTNTYTGTITGTYDAATKTLKYSVDCTGKYLLVANFHAIVDFEGTLEN